MPDYSNGKIYAIRSYQTNSVYVGSTTQSLAMRMVGHRKRYKTWQADNNRKWLSSYELLALGDAYIELLEACPCANRNELHRAEGQQIRALDCVNRHIAGRTRQEWNSDNAESISVKMKVYRQVNKERINVKKKTHYQANKERIKARLSQPWTCPCGSTVRINEKARHEKSKKHLKYQA